MYLVCPGIMSTLPPICGTQNEWMTSAESSRMCVVRPWATYTSLGALNPSSLKSKSHHHCLPTAVNWAPGAGRLIRSV